MTADCLAPRHHDEPEPGDRGASLCRGCQVHLSRDLRRLPGLYAELNAVIVPGRQPGSRGTGDGLPYNDRASECRSQIEHDLRYWTTETLADRRAAPAVMTVAAMAGLLRGALKWIIFRPWCGDMAAAVGDVRGQAVALLDPWVTRRIPVPGACPACHGRNTLTVTVYASDGDRRRSHANCGECGAVWLPEQWTRLGQQITKQAA